MDLKEIVKNAEAHGDGVPPLFPNHIRFIEGYVVKREYFCCEERIQTEFDIGRKLYDNGISCPQMYGVVFVEGDCFTEKGLEQLKFPYLVMSRLSGVHPNNLLSNSIQLMVAEKFIEQLQRAVDLGITPLDYMFPGNIIYNPDTEDVSLLDFGRWVNRPGAWLPDSKIHVWDNRLPKNPDEVLSYWSGFRMMNAMMD